MARYPVTGRTVVITGACGGLGSALAEALRVRGANLALLDLSLDATTAAAQQLAATPLPRGSAPTCAISPACRQR